MVYRAEDFHHRKVPLSAYLTAELRDADAGGTIELELVSKSGGSGQYHTVTYAYGNNVWLPIIAQNIALVAVSTVLALLGLVTIPVCLAVRRRTPSVKTVLYLGEAILVAGLWSLSESPLRQLIFRAPSGSNVFAFLLVEILAAFVLMYFNELQKHRYDRLYVSLEACILIQALVNAALNATELVDYYNTLIFSHIWLARGGLDRLEALAADWKGSCSRGISVSCGLSFAVDCADLDALVREADHRMYENKRAFYAKSGNDRKSR